MDISIVIFMKKDRKKKREYYGTVAKKHMVGVGVSKQM